MNDKSNNSEKKKWKDAQQKLSDQLMNCLVEKKNKSDGGTSKKDLSPSHLDKLIKCLNPIQSQDDTIYGYRDIRETITNPFAHGGKWECPSGSMVLMDNTKIENGAQLIDYALNFYHNKMESMCRSYFKKLTDEGYMKSFAEVSKMRPMIDTTRLYKHQNPYNTSLIDGTQMALCVPVEELMSNIWSYGWKTFIPNQRQMVLKHNIKRYYLLDVYDVDYINKHISVRIEDYQGDKYDWMIYGKVDFTLIFDEECEGSLRWEINNVDCFKEIVSFKAYDMDWSLRDGMMWCDLYKTYGLNDIALIECYRPIINEETGEVTIDKDDEDKYITLQYQKEAIDFILSSKYCRAKAKYYGHDAREYLHQRTAMSYVKDYIRYMSYITTITWMDMSSAEYPPSQEPSIRINDEATFYGFNDSTIESQIAKIRRELRMKETPRQFVKSTSETTALTE